MHLYLVQLKQGGEWKRQCPVGRENHSRGPGQRENDQEWTQSPLETFSIQRIRSLTMCK